MNRKQAAKHKVALAISAAMLLGGFGASSSRAATLEVGDAKPFPTLEKALAAAKPGDDILVYPLKSGPYLKAALQIKTPRLTLRAADPKTTIIIDGKGFDYSGRGSVPRAIFQFDPGADGCTLEGFQLSHAHNDSHNGAGVRINQANDITIRRCTISGNDMGIMSNGKLAQKTAANQLIEGCTIAQNGDPTQPGYNHNLYLGGTSVTVRGCEIFGALTGHNLKSRAHQNWIEYNFIHDSANRELDLVDEKGNTDAPASDTVLLGNLIRKKPAMDGNKAVIHFGRDGGADHTGTLWLVHNTIVTPYSSPVVDLSAPGAKLILYNNDFTGIKTLATARNGAAKPTGPAIGSGNLLPPNIGEPDWAGPLVTWDKIPLPWDTFAKRPEPLQAFQSVGTIAPVPGTPRPGTNTKP